MHPDLESYLSLIKTGLPSLTIDAHELFWLRVMIEFRVYMLLERVCVCVCVCERKREREREREQEGWVNSSTDLRTVACHRPLGNICPFLWGGFVYVRNFGSVGRKINNWPKTCAARVGYIEMRQHICYFCYAGLIHSINSWNVCVCVGGGGLQYQVLNHFLLILDCVCSFVTSVF